VCPILTPSTFIYRPEHWRDDTPSTPGMDSRANQETPRRRRLAVTRSVRPTPCGPHSPYAFSWWLSGGSLSQFEGSTWFGGGLDTFMSHMIHVMHTCRLLIRRPPLPSIGDVNNPWYLAWHPLIS
jgi:hypothetical protein